MPEMAHPYQIVFFTSDHLVNGTIFLRDQRLSDFLNDRREKNIVVRNAGIARLENPAKILQKTQVSVLPKSGIVLAFEPPQKESPPPRRFIKYPKDRYGIYVILDGMEVRGEIHVQGSLDLLRIMADSSDAFLPITQATVTIQANPNVLLQREAIVINTQRIRFIGEVELPKTSSVSTTVPQ